MWWWWSCPTTTSTITKVSAAQRLSICELHCTVLYSIESLTHSLTNSLTPPHSLDDDFCLKKRTQANLDVIYNARGRIIKMLLIELNVDGAQSTAEAAAFLLCCCCYSSVSSSLLCSLWWCRLPPPPPEFGFCRASSQQFGVVLRRLIEHFCCLSFFLSLWFLWWSASATSVHSQSTDELVCLSVSFCLCVS